MAEKPVSYWAWEGCAVGRRGRHGKVLGASVASWGRPPGLRRPRPAPGKADEGVGRGPGGPPHENRIHAFAPPAVYLIEDESSGIGDGGAGDQPEGWDSVLAAARAGDRAAFDLLMRRHERLVLGTAYRLAGNLEDAQDASQEVFLRLYRNLAKLDSGNLAAWLYR